MTQLDDDAAGAAAYRALAAEDRRAAARDRELAAQERLRALVDREALAARRAPEPGLKGGSGERRADPVDLGVRELRVDRQRQHLGAGLLGRGARQLAAAPGEHRLARQRRRVVHERRDAVAVQVLAQRVAVGAAHDVLVKDVRAPRRDADGPVRRAGERRVVAGRDRAAPGGPCRVVADELVVQDRRRGRRELRVVAELDMRPSPSRPCQRSRRRCAARSSSSVSTAPPLPGAATVFVGSNEQQLSRPTAPAQRPSAARAPRACAASSTSASAVLARQRLSAGASKTWPNRSTARIARVRSDSAPRAAAGSSTRCSSTSANTGTAPARRTHDADAMNEIAGTTTSSPGRTPAATSAKNSASVPEPTATAWRRSQRSASAASNAATAALAARAPTRAPRS